MLKSQSRKYSRNVPNINTRFIARRKRKVSMQYAQQSQASNKLLCVQLDFQFLDQLPFDLYLGILFDRSIPFRLLKPPFSPFSFPFSFTIFRQDTCAKSKLATYHLDWFRRWALIDLTSFNSSAPTFLSRSPTIPRAEILQEIQVDRIPMWVFNSSVIYYVQCTHAISKG